MCTPALGGASTLAGHKRLRQASGIFRKQWEAQWEVSEAFSKEWAVFEEFKKQHWTINLFWNKFSAFSVIIYMVASHSHCPAHVLAKHVISCSAETLAGKACISSANWPCFHFCFYGDFSCWLAPLLLCSSTQRFKKPAIFCLVDLFWNNLRAKKVPYVDRGIRQQLSYVLQQTFLAKPSV